MRSSGLRALLPIAMGVTLALGLTCAASPARAGDLAAAEVLFNDGQKLFDAGRIHEACEKFQESYTQDPAIGTMINLARCHEKEGKTASAWGEYKTVETLASRANQPQRQQYAHDEAAKLEPTLHQLVLSVKFPVDGLEVTRNGTGVGKALWGEKIPVDPGDVVLKATAPGKKPWSQPVHLAAGPGVDHFDIPKLEDAPIDQPKGGGGGKETVIVTANGMGTTKIVGLVVAGVGVVAGGVAAAFQLTALAEDSKSKQVDSNLIKTEQSSNPGLCAPSSGAPDKNTCPNAYSSYTHHDAAKTDQYVAIGFMAGGGAMIITGLVLFFTSGSAETTKKTEKTGFTLVPSFAPGQGGLTAVGTF